MFGVLVVVLGRNPIARLEFSLGQCQVSVIVSSRVGDVTINRLWEVLDGPELKRALGIEQTSRTILGRKKPPV